MQFYNVNGTYRALYNLYRCKITNHHYLQNAAENGAVRNWCGLQNPTHKAKTYISRPSLLERGSQLNFGGIGVELRMKERTIEEGIHVNHAVSPLIGLDFQGILLRKQGVQL